MQNAPAQAEGKEEDMGEAARWEKTATEAVILKFDPSAACQVSVVRTSAPRHAKPAPPRRRSLRGRGYGLSKSELAWARGAGVLLAAVSLAVVLL